MNPRLAVVLAAASLVLLSMGTGGFTAGTADRGLTLATAGPDHQYVGLELSAVPGGDAANLTVTVENRLVGVSLSSVTVTVGSESNEVLEGSALSPGQAATATIAGVDCGETVTIEAAGDGATFSTDRQVDCD